MPYKDAFQLLVDIGLVEVILPFILVFTITYGVLQRTQILGAEAGKPKKRLNAMVAFVMGFIAVAAANMLNVINIMLFYLVLLLVIGLLLALVLGLVGAEGGARNRLFVAIMAVLLVLFIFFALARAGVIDENRFFNTIIWPVIMIVVIALTIYFIFRKKPSEKKHGAGRRSESVHEQPRVSAEGERHI